ncbi:hypothetical protein L1987_75805 [Smallanthus sonchifolius]|uniref:Uncharacterized protein n=1 Tax=Smallanthus sonchifolius TaxID=185202 RepID=A0ACB9A7Q7_9ASTR|nr:hypothetical protein L1987_75805 [Smallanthus sonchifolius]
MKDCMTVDCNDSGVAFIVAHTGCRLDKVLKNPPTDSMCDFVPFKTFCFQDNTEGLVGIQVTTFEYEARLPEGAVVNPDFTTARELFPPTNHSVEELQKITNNFNFKATSLVQRRYVFSKNAIASLQAEATNKTMTHKPTRNEALTSFMWKHLTEASRTIAGSLFTSAITIAVSFRPRLKPPLSSNCFGNLALSPPGLFYPSSKSEMSHLAHEIKLNIVSADSDFIAKLQQPGVIHEMMQGAESRMMEGIKQLVFTNWCNMGHYGIDFGWGIPAWVAFALKNDILNARYTIFMYAPSGTGIEVNVIGEEAEVSIMERNQEFLEFATINRSVVTC